MSQVSSRRKATVLQGAKALCTASLLFTAADVWAAGTVTTGSGVMYSPAGGLLPAGVTQVGGLVIDLVGVNGTRIVSEIPASMLWDGTTKVADTPIGTATGFSSALLNSLGGSLSKASFRVTVWDGNNSPGEFDYQRNTLQGNGVSLGNFSGVQTIETDSTGNTVISTNPGGGFRGAVMDTGFFYVTDSAALASLLSSLQSKGSIQFSFVDSTPGGNILDFTLGYDSSLPSTGYLPGIGSPTLVVQNSSPINTPTSTDYVVNAPTVTGSGNQNNTLRSVTFAPGMSFTISGSSTLTVSSGQISTLSGSTSSSFIGGTLACSTGFLFDVQSDLSVSSVIASTWGVEKTGLGTLTLTGANTYAGTTAVTTGTLIIGNGKTGSIQSRAVSIANGTALVINMGPDTVLASDIANDGLFRGISPNTVTVTGTIFGAGALAMDGSGELILAGENTYTGATSVNNGVLIIGTGTTGSVSDATTFSVGTNGTLVFDSPSEGILNHTVQNDGWFYLAQSATDSYTYTAGISGAGSFGKACANTLILGGTNTYAGVTVIAEGTLRPLAGAIPVLSPVGVLSGATLDAGGLALNLGSLGGDGNVTNISVLSVGANNGDDELTGVISGSGKIVKVGSGMWMLSGDNTYTGATEVKEGMLQIGNGATGSILSSSAVSVWEEAMLTVDLGNNGVLSNNISNAGMVMGVSANTNTFSGVISGSGNLVQGGLGQLILSGSNTYTGPTVVAVGTLRIAGSISPVSLLGVMPEGTLILDSPDSSLLTHAITNDGVVVLEESALSNYTFSGGISGAGSVEKAGANTLTLGGTNTYTGATVISAGTLRPESQAAIPTTSVIQLNSGATLDLAGLSFSLGSLTGNGTVATGSNSVLTVGGNNTNTVFAGTINGAGELQKVGGGVWNLTGANASTGLTSVLGGSLLVNGSLQGDLHVLSGILGGGGVIHGNVVNKALVSPGNSPGKLTISGNYSQTSTGSLLIQLASRTVADQLVVGGAANLGGSLQVVTLGGYRVRNGATYTILTAANGVTGKFSDIGTASILKLDVVYQANSVILKSYYSLFSEVAGMTPNEQIVAKTLDKMLLNDKYYNNAVFNKLVDFINQYQTKDVPLALEQLVPTDLVILPDASFNLAQIQAANLERRMEEIRSGYAEFHATTTSPSTYYNSSATTRNDGVQYLGADGRELCPTPLDRNLGFFLNGSGEFVNENSTTMATAGKFTTGGVSTGGDYRFNNDWLAVGLTAGYANTSTEGRGDGVVGIDSGNLGVYTTAFRDGFYVNGIMGGGCNNYDVKRDTLGGLARGDTSGYNFNALLGTGYTCYVNALSVGPIASLRYSWVGIDGFAEHGSLAPLDIQEQNKSSVKSTLGFQVAYALPAGSVTVKPQVRAQWKHEYANDSRDIGASFLNNAYTVTGPTLGTDSLLVDVGVTVQINPALGVYAYYNGDIGASNYTANSVFGGVQVNF